MGYIKKTLILIISIIILIFLWKIAFKSSGSGISNPEFDALCEKYRSEFPKGDYIEIKNQIPKVPEGHPRVYLTPQEVERIRQEIKTPEFKEVWNEVLEGTKDQNAGYLLKAFVYLINGDKKMGRESISESISALKSSQTNLNFGDPFHLSAMVYDWTYDLSTTDEKKEFVKEFERIAKYDPDGICHPAIPNAPGVVGHQASGPLLTGQLPVGVAIYDENKSMYDNAAFTFFYSFKPVRDFYFKGHSPHHGDSYGPTYVNSDIMANWLFTRMGDSNAFSKDQQYLPYRTLYNLRPDGQQLRFGDTHDDSGKHPSKTLFMQLTAYYYDDPYLYYAYKKPLFNSIMPFDGLFTLMFKSENLISKPIDDLPLTKYFAEPIGTMIARTGWEMGVQSNDAVISMDIGQYFFGGHQDVGHFGTFQIYYKGPLAISSGVYQGGEEYGGPHWSNYYHQSISKNGLLIFDPDEKKLYANQPVANDGGTRWPNNGNDHPISLEYMKENGYEMGKVLAHEFGPNKINPEYSYISGDITKAYTTKVSKVTRSMAAFNNNDPAYPATLVVFDRISSTNSEFKKTWLLHSIQEPKIEGNKVTVLRDQEKYSGKLVEESLLPKNAAISKIGGEGKEFWIESANKNFYASKAAPAEPGEWRIEISPIDKNKDDLFLNVMTVMDKKTVNNPRVELIEGTNVVGAHFLNRIALFSKGGETLNNAMFVVNSEGNNILVCDLIPGYWTVEKDGKEIERNLVSTEEGKCVYFKGDAGNYKLEKTSTLL